VSNSFTGVPAAKLTFEDDTGGVKGAAGEEVEAAVDGGGSAAEAAASDGDKESGVDGFVTGKSFPVNGCALCLTHLRHPWPLW
jgi:hypothetical protein